jgi:hypothetical protein
MPTLDWNKPIELVNHQGKIFQARLALAEIKRHPTSKPVKPHFE